MINFMKKITVVLLIIIFFMIPVCNAQVKDRAYFKSTYGLSDFDVDIIENRTENLTKYINLVDEALKDGTYQEYNKLIDNHYSIDFKDNYNAFLLLKNNNELSEDEISRILYIIPYPCLSLNVFKYRGTKSYKVEKVLNKKKLSSSEKYNKIYKLAIYRKATFKDIKKDIKARAQILGIALTGVGLFLLLAMPNSDPDLVEIGFFR